MQAKFAKYIQNFVVKYGSKLSLERGKFRVFDNIKMDFEEDVT